MISYSDSLQLPVLYSDHMVLQRDKPFEVSGVGGHEEVLVRFAGLELHAHVCNGKWAVKVPALPAGGPYCMEISSNSDRLVYNDVWMGDVWLCSGQSNMEYPLSRAATAEADLKAVCNNPRLHLFNMLERYITDEKRWSDDACAEVAAHRYFDTTSGWEYAHSDNAARFSAIAYHFGRLLSHETGVHIGLVLNAVGGSTCESWIQNKILLQNVPFILDDWHHNEWIQPWVIQRAIENAGTQTHPYQPGYLFKAGIEPLKHTMLKGVIWYQGESNAHNISLHEVLFPMMVACWRSFFNDDCLPVYFVQLSSVQRSTWPAFRNSQLLMSEQIPNCWMVVSSDCGEPDNVHPAAKRPIGERLAHAALHHTYGMKHVVPSGPLRRGAYVCDRKVYVVFDYADGLQPSNGNEILGFEVCDGGYWYKAEAKVVGQTIQLFFPGILQPTAVRYGWQPYSQGNLINSAGLPASTFKLKIDVK